MTVVLDRKSSTCKISLHVGGMAIYDYREALRPSNRLVLHLRVSTKKKDEPVVVTVVTLVGHKNCTSSNNLRVLNEV